MKSVSAGVRVAILFMLLAIGAYIVWKNLGQNPAGKDTQELFAKFRDASGLPKGSKVVVAGLPKGEVIDLTVDGRYARVTFRVSTDIPVWTSAVVFKKATSLLGENYLEIDPGEDKRQGPDGTVQTFTRLGPPCDGYDSSDPKKSDPCREIRNVVEATTPDELMHHIDETIPHVDQVLESVRDLSEDLRRITNGPLASVANRIDGLVQKNAQKVDDIIDRANRITQKADEIANDLRDISHDADPKIKDILQKLDETSAAAKDLVATAKSELTQTGDKVREKLDHIDNVISNTESITQKINEPKGTLGKIVNEPDIAENIEEITNSGRDFLSTVFGLKAYVGLRSEYNFRAGLLRSYISVELHTRPDKFYLIEVEKGPRGDYPDVTLTFDPTVDPNHWIRRSVIEDAVRFTFQFAKRFSWLTLRFGLKESTGGVGADANLSWLNRELVFQADVFDATFDTYPRVKLTAALEVVRHFYLLGGVDELLNTPATLNIVKGNSAVPIQFDEFHYGRDFFLGGMLRFNDEDLAALLTVGGSAVSGASGR